MLDLLHDLLVKDITNLPRRNSYWLRHGSISIYRSFISFLKDDAKLAVALRHRNVLTAIEILDKLKSPSQAHPWERPAVSEDVHLALEPIFRESPESTLGLLFHTTEEEATLKEFTLMFRETLSLEATIYDALSRDKLKVDTWYKQLICWSILNWTSSKSLFEMLLERARPDSEILSHLPLRLAIVKNNVQAAETLLAQEEIDREDENIFVALSKCESEDIFGILLSHSRLDLNSYICQNILVSSFIRSDRAKMFRRLIEDPRVDPMQFLSQVIVAKTDAQCLKAYLECPRVTIDEYEDEFVREAATSGTLRVLEILLSDPRIGGCFDPNDGTFLQEVVKSNRDDVPRYLVKKYGQRVTMSLYNPRLLDMAFLYDADKVISFFIHVNGFDPSEDSFLREAARVGSYKVLDVLLQHPYIDPSENSNELFECLFMTVYQRFVRKFTLSPQQTATQKVIDSLKEYPAPKKIAALRIGRDLLRLQCVIETFEQTYPGENCRLKGTVFDEDFLKLDALKKRREPNDTFKKYAVSDLAPLGTSNNNQSSVSPGRSENDRCPKYAGVLNAYNSLTNVYSIQ